MRTLVIAIMILSFSLAGCSVSQVKKDDILNATSTVASTAQTLAKQFNQVYAYLVEQKLVADHTKEATIALAMMDAVAPLVQQGTEALKGDNFNWAKGVLEFAIITAQAMGYVLPLLGESREPQFILKSAIRDWINPLSVTLVPNPFWPGKRSSSARVCFDWVVVY